MSRQLLLSIQEARNFLATSYGLDFTVEHLAVIAFGGEGPRTTFDGARTLYGLDDLDAWAQSRTKEPEPLPRFGQQPTPEQIDAARAQVAEWREATRELVMAGDDGTSPRVGWGDGDLHPVLTALRATVRDAVGGEAPLTNAQARAVASAEDMQKVADIYGLPVDALIAQASVNGPCTRGDVEVVAYGLRKGVLCGHSIISQMDPRALAEVTRDRSGELH